MRKREKEKIEKKIVSMKKLPLAVIMLCFIFIFTLIILINFPNVVSVVRAQSLTSPQPSYAQYNYVSSAKTNTQSASYVRTQYYQPSFRRYYSGGDVISYSQLWPTMGGEERCEARQDFLVQVSPEGCAPAVVRSDLLEEQNVPVFCQLDAIKLNPLIDVEGIKHIRPVQTSYSDYVAGVGYHPARAALRTYDRLLGSPTLDNVGYVVVLLKRQVNESSMPEWVEANFSATMMYDVERAYGIGRAEFYLPVMAEDEWDFKYKQSSFWGGKGYVRAEWIETDPAPRAGISIYTDSNHKLSSVVLERGKTSRDIFIPGYYCRAGLQVRLNDIVVPEKRVRIEVDDNEFELFEGDKFLDGRCGVERNSIKIYGDGAGEVTIRCPRGERFTLRILPEDIMLDVNVDDYEGEVEPEPEEEEEEEEEKVWKDKDLQSARFAVNVISADLVFPDEHSFIYTNGGWKYWLFKDDGDIDELPPNNNPLGIDFVGKENDYVEGVRSLLHYVAGFSPKKTILIWPLGKAATPEIEKLWPKGGGQKEISASGLNLKNEKDFEKYADKVFSTLAEWKSGRTSGTANVIKSVTGAAVTTGGKIWKDDMLKPGILFSIDDGVNKHYYFTYEDDEWQYYIYNRQTGRYSERKSAAGEKPLGIDLGVDYTEGVKNLFDYATQYGVVGLVVYKQNSDKVDKIFTEASNKKLEDVFEQINVETQEPTTPDETDEDVDESEPEEDYPYYSVGKIVYPKDYPSSKEKIYLAYSGKLPDYVSDYKNKSFIVLVTTRKSQEEIDDAGLQKKIYDYLKRKKARDASKGDVEFEDFKQDLQKERSGLSKDYDAFVLLEKGDSELIVVDRGGGDKKEVKIKFVEKKIEDEDYTYKEELWGKEFEENFDAAIQSYRDVARFYAAEKPEGILQDKQTFGETSLEKAAELAGYTKKQKTRNELLQEHIGIYPDRKSAEIARQKLEKESFLNFEDARYATVVDNIGRIFVLKEIIEPSIKEAGAQIEIFNSTGTVSEGWFRKDDEIIDRGKTKDGDRIYIKVENLLDQRGVKQVVVGYECSELDDEGKRRTIRKSETVEDGKIIRFCDYSLHIEKVNLEKLAKVSLIPKAYNELSQVNFTFKVGIEKRAIKLSPEKTKEMIENINESIEKWENVVEKLGKVVSTLKGGCFATAAFLTIKNFFSNVGGKSMARQKVMRMSGGWMDKCTVAVSLGEPIEGTGHKPYATIDDCLRQNAARIDKDVSLIQKQIESYNDKIKQMDDMSEEEKRDRNFERMKSGFAEDVEDMELERINKTLDVAGFLKNLGKEHMNYEEMKTIEWALEVKEDDEASSTLREAAERQLYDTVDRVKKKKNLFAAPSVTADLAGVDPSKIGQVYKDPKEKYAERMYQGLRRSELNQIESIEGIGELEGNTPVDIVPLDNGKTALVILSREREGYSISKSYYLNKQAGKFVLGKEIPEQQQLNIKYSRSDRIDYNNKYREPEIKFFETEPYKGSPAIVPFDTQNGWYAATKQVLPTFGNIKPFDESGRVTSFWLCNVGENGIEEFYSNRDICMQFNMDTGQSLGVFPGLTPQQARQKVDDARRALRRAAEQHGQKVIDIFGERFEVGKPAANIPGTQCQDFMSPKDCHLLFNLCDPVICPPSRCNFGGKYHVSDVIQTGIVGGVFLCLPNAKEGIKIPFCLSGIHAGLDSYVSILKSHRDCLEESLRTGRNVGICDQIKSVYICEFFWRQFTPLLNVLIPKMVGYLYGLEQGKRGGGEYLTVMHAWQNAKKSVEYFTTFYARNAFEAFRIRSLGEVGTAFCRRFISTKFPSDIKTLLEPESPAQFHAWFSEIPYTTATVPATSHYKVFYHIFAGRDQGTYYSVYLKRDVEYAFYDIPLYYMVDTGYISRGDYAQESIDFTAPAGYKEMCVRINLNEQCGFKQVSTSFALNYLRDQYMDQQATQNIMGEKECISGTPSPYPLLQPNIQAGAEEAVLPQIYERGVIRVCSTDNPGLGTDPGRWQDVGYCDDENIRCWLDKRSVESAITEGNIGMLNKTLSELEDMQIRSFGGFDRENATNKLGKIEDSKTKTWNEFEVKKDKTSSDINKLITQYNKLIDDLIDIEDQAVYTQHKARALAKRGELYEKIARAIFDIILKPRKSQEKPLVESGVGEPKEPTVEPSVVTTVPPTPEEPPEPEVRPPQIPPNWLSVELEEPFQPEEEPPEIPPSYIAVEAEFNEQLEKYESWIKEGEKVSGIKDSSFKEGWEDDHLEQGVLLEFSYGEWHFLDEDSSINILKTSDKLKYFVMYREIEEDYIWMINSWIAPDASQEVKEVTERLSKLDLGSGYVSGLNKIIDAFGDKGYIIIGDKAWHIEYVFKYLYDLKRHKDRGEILPPPGEAEEGSDYPDADI